jgi:hypothetical protein
MTVTERVCHRRLSAYNALVLNRVWMMAFILLGHCGHGHTPSTGQDHGSPHEQAAALVPTTGQLEAMADRSRAETKAPGGDGSAREEAQRRAEAVRRAIEEVALRGAATNNYLINLSRNDDRYRVAFVDRRGRSLAAEVTVVVRRQDLEVLAVEGLLDRSNHQ